MSEATNEEAGNEEAGNEEAGNEEAGNEEVTESATDATTETPTEPTVEVNDEGIPLVVIDGFGELAYGKAKVEAEHLSTLTAEIDASQGNTSAMQENFREIYGTDADSEATPEDRKAREQIEKLLSAALKLEQERDSKINARIEALTADSAATIAPKLEEQSKLLERVKAVYKTLTTMYGDNATYGLPTVKGIRKAGSASSAGTGAPRIRKFDVYVNGVLATQKDNEGKAKSNLSAGAKAASVDTSTMQQAFWTAQGTQDASKFKESVEFEVVGSDGKTYAVVARKQPE